MLCIKTNLTDISFNDQINTIMSIYAVLIYRRDGRWKDNVSDHPFRTCWIVCAHIIIKYTICVLTAVIVRRLLSCFPHLSPPRHVLLCTHLRFSQHTRSEDLRRLLYILRTLCVYVCSYFNYRIIQTAAWKRFVFATSCCTCMCVCVCQ